MSGGQSSIAKPQKDNARAKCSWKNGPILWPSAKCTNELGLSGPLVWLKLMYHSKRFLSWTSASAIHVTLTSNPTEFTELVWTISPLHVYMRMHSWPSCLGVANLYLVSFLLKCKLSVSEACARCSRSTQFWNCLALRWPSIAICIGLNAICVRLALEPPSSDHSSSGSHQLCHACLQFRKFIGVGIVSVFQLKFSGLEFLDHRWPSLIHLVS